VVNGLWRYLNNELVYYASERFGGRVYSLGLLVRLDLLEILLVCGRSSRFEVLLEVSLTLIFVFDLLNKAKRERDS
jgi:hypothetical protein